MSDLNSVLLTVLLLLGSALIVVLIFIAFRAVKMLDGVQHEITKLNDSMIPLLDGIRSLSERADGTLSMLDRNSDAITDSVNAIRRVTGNIERLENIVQSEIEPTLVDFASVIGSARKGVQAFISSWRRPR